MKVILISRVANYGNIGDVVEVKDGYARNFLIPKGKAIHYNKTNYASFESKQKEFEAKNAQAKKDSEAIKKLVIGKDIVIIENASDDGRLYGAVNATVLAKKINEIDSKLEIGKSEISLDKPIKETGVYNVTLSLHSEVEFGLRVIVSRNESEIDTVIKQAKVKAQQEKASQEQEKSEEKSSQEASSDTTKTGKEVENQPAAE